MHIARAHRSTFMLIGALALALPIIVRGLSAPVSAADAEDPAQALIRLDEEWSRAAATKNAERVASFYADNAIAYPPNEPMAIGREAARKVWAAYFADSSFSISGKTLHAAIAGSNDLGYTAGTYEAAYIGPGGKPVTEKGKFLCAWQRQKDGTWKAIHDMWNADAR